MCKEALAISWKSYTIFANLSLQYALSKFGLFFPDDYLQTSCIVFESRQYYFQLNMVFRNVDLP